MIKERTDKVMVTLFSALLKINVFIPNYTASQIECMIFFKGY